MIKDRTSPQSFKSLVADYYYGRDKNRVRFPEWFEKWYTPESDYNYDSDCGMAIPMCCIAAPIDYEVLCRQQHNKFYAHGRLIRTTSVPHSVSA